MKSRDDVLTVLTHLGYLAYDRNRKEVYVPNEEVRSAFANAVRGTDWTPVVQAIQKSEQLLEATWSRRGKGMGILCFSPENIRINQPWWWN